MRERRQMSRLAKLARAIATHPIEAIVLTFIYVTIAYFQLLQAVKDSEFLNAADAASRASVPAFSTPQPVLSLERNDKNEWLPLQPASASDQSAARQVYIKQILVQPAHRSASGAASLHLDSVSGLDKHLRAAPAPESSASFDQGLCFKTPKGQCFVASALSDSKYDGSAQNTVLFYGLDKDQPSWPSPAALQWSDETAEVDFQPVGHHLKSRFSVASLGIHHPDSSRSASGASSTVSGGGLGISLPLSPKQGASFAEEELTSWHYHASRSTIREMAGLKWAFYAVRAFILRFWSLAKQADSADLAVMLVAYLLMHLTFVSLYINMRKIGSRFWLASAVLVASMFGFICSLFAAYLLNITVNPVTLSEALPFMVVVIGFEKPFILARAVFTHRQAVGGYSEPVRSVSEDRRMLSSLSFITEEATAFTQTREIKPAQDIVGEAVQRYGARIVRDYAIEIVVLLCGALSGVHGLTEFCQLGALILAIDCASLFTLYVAFLTVILEVRRIRSMRNVRSRDSGADLANILDDESTPAAPVEGLTLRQTFVKLLTGTAPGVPSQDSPSRIKLFLVAAFIGLHVLNLCTPLSNHFRGTPPPAAHLSSAVNSMLQQLSLLYPAGTRLVAHVSAPILVQMSTPGFSADQWSASADSFSSVSPLGILDRIFTVWTGLTSDPVMSKWISLALGISVFLNGYLLKGIALGSSRVEAAETAARILLAATGQISPVDTKPGKVLRRHSSGADSLQHMRKTFPQRFQDAPIPEEPRSRTSSQSSLSKPDLAPLSPIETLSERRSSVPAAASVDSASALQRPTIAVSGSSSRATSSVISENGTSTPATTAFDSEEGALAPHKPRAFDICAQLFDGGHALLLSDEEIILLVQKGKVAAYSLEKLLQDHQRAVRIRRALISRASITKSLEASSLPYMHYDYSKVMGQCCENVVGYTPIPVGIAGPLRVDGVSLPIPMATTEGALVASTSRGCKALNAGGGVTTVLHADAMTRGPAIEFNSLIEAAAAKRWIESGEGETTIKASFNSTSRFARLQRLKCALAGRTLYVRFATQTGDAMGMNMISKGTERALETMMEHFPGMRIVSLSGNYCIDKKPAAINWIEGRGKSVVAEAVIPGAIVKTILKTTVADVAKLNITKNLIGSAMAGSVGGFNAHASNILTAIYLATGQDPAQNVESSQCMTLMEPINDGQDLLMTCSMPCIEVGTIGGGTILGPQRAMLDMLGVGGPHPDHPGQNAQTLARIICASVMAGELSLMSALASGHLVKSHLALNRSAPATPATQKFTGHNGLTPAPTRPNTPGPVHLKAGFAFTAPAQ